MKAVLLAVAFTGLLPGLASAQKIGGTYTVRGTNFDGSGYSGEAEITFVTNTTCEISWKTGGTASTGLCMRNDDAFAASYSMGGDVGLIVYKASPDGTLRGLWTVKGRNGSGTEVLTPK